mmetsp:Transcript_48299/g.54751  ORF Transcript_48299/g.54751 Transcript_48299/m.54751 type:complete len:150 (-) Transcript_48299:351-800(-)
MRAALVHISTSTHTHTTNWVERHPPPEQHLLTMPLQSPSGDCGGGTGTLQLTPFLQHHFPSPSGATGGGSGFTPPQTRPRVRSGEGVEGFPILSLAPTTTTNNNNDGEGEGNGTDARDRDRDRDDDNYNDGTRQPPHPKLSKGPKSSHR